MCLISPFDVLSSDSFCVVSLFLTVVSVIVSHIPLHSAHLDARIKPRGHDVGQQRTGEGAHAAERRDGDRGIDVVVENGLDEVPATKPLMAKIDSVMTAPVNTEAMENATLTAVGIRDARNAWRRMAWRRVRPFARRCARNRRASRQAGRCAASDGRRPCPESSARWSAG